MREPPSQDERYTLSHYPRRVRGPRFALLILIIMAIMSLLLALWVWVVYVVR
jgi:cytoskeletal protein RodZ